MTLKTASLANICSTHQGKASDKWSIYIREYERLFRPYRPRPIRMLEIGIQNGGSLEIWAKYFAKGKKFVGCDINPECNKLSFDDARITLFVMDANTDAAEHAILDLSNEFDIIIDDGSHHSGDIVRSFSRYFPHLKTGGLYVAEDLHCSYWQDFEGGLYRPNSSMAFFKQLADVINHEHWGIPKSRADLIDRFNKAYGENISEAELEKIHAIEFVNSMCIIRKADLAENILGQRFISGSQAIVWDGVLQLHGTTTPEPDQSENIWTQPQTTLVDELAQRLQDIAHLDRQMENLKTQLTNTEQDHKEQLQTYQDQLTETKNQLAAQLELQLQREAHHNDQIQNLQHQYSDEKLGIEQKLHEQIEKLQRDQAEKEWLSSERIHSLYEEVKSAQVALQRREQEFANREQEYFNQIHEAKGQIELLLTSEIEGSKVYSQKLMEMQERQEREKQLLEHRLTEEISRLQQEYAEHEWLANERIQVLQERLYESQQELQRKEWTYAEQLQQQQSELSEWNSKLHQALEASIQNEEAHNKQLNDLYKTTEQERSALITKYESQLQSIQTHQAEHEWLTAERAVQLEEQTRAIQLEAHNRERKLLEEISLLIKTQQEREDTLTKEISIKEREILENETSLRLQLEKQHVEYIELIKNSEDKAAKDIAEINDKAKEKITKIQINYDALLSEEKNLRDQIIEQVKLEAANLEEVKQKNELQNKNWSNEIEKLLINLNKKTQSAWKIKYGSKKSPAKAHLIEILYASIGSEENKFIEYSYEMLLNRKPDKEGHNHYVKKLAEGYTRIQVLEDITKSKEFLKKNLRESQKTKNQDEKMSLIKKIVKAIRIKFRPEKTTHEKDLITTPELTGSKNNSEVKFDPQWYIDRYPDVKAAGIDPLEHYIKHGIEEGRHPYFDREWYLNEYPDVAESGVDPLQHFIKHGEIEGRFPLFHTEWYLNTYPDVAASGMIPVEHYIKHGMAEGRFPAHSKYANKNNDYKKWIQEYQEVDDHCIASIKSKINKMKYKPLISIVMPVYNTEVEWLEEAIMSVKNQIYPNWELCIADDASTDSAIRPILEKYKKIDNRIKIVFRKENGHISAASNSAISIATGEWIALLDNDDTLTEHALFWVADTINKEQEAKLIYSDEDKIDEKGNLYGPYFKSDWNVDLFYSHNLITHLGVYNTEIVKKIGGFRVGYEGSQDYDLALRFIEQINAKQIHHIPRVLYHWRVHENSTAKSMDAKPYAAIAGEKAIKEHFNRTGIDAKVQFIKHGYRVTYAIPLPEPLVSLIIPTKNGLELIKQCIDSITKKTTYKNYEIIIVDNGSDDSKALEYFKEASKDEKIRVIRDDGPFNYSRINNDAVKLAKGDLIGLINNDIEVITPDWLTEMVSHACRPNIGAVGAKLLYPDNRIQHAGVIVGIGGVAGHSHKFLDKEEPGYFSRANVIQSMSAVTAACLLVKKTLFHEVGGLNEVDLKVAFNDVDFCLKLQEKGYRNIYTPYAILYHHESASRGYEDSPEKIARFEKEVDYMKQRWADVIKHDPAYSPNLTVHHEDFSYAWPPRISKLPNVEIDKEYSVTR